jgi:type IV pilus assembly protein PilO
MALLPTDPAQQKRLLIGLVPLVLAFAYYQFVHTGRAETITGLESTLEQLERTNTTSRALAAQGGPELERRLAVYEQHMQRLEELIPRREQVPELLHSMTLRAQTSNVELTRVKPEGEEASPYYTRQSYEIGVRGTYHDVGQFLAQVGSLPRIITPTDFRVMATGFTDKKNGGPLLSASFRIITYIVPEAVAPADSAGTHATS